MLVEAELIAMNFPSYTIQWGEVETGRELTPYELAHFNQRLQQIGLEIIHDKKSILIEKIKNIIIEMIYFSDEEPVVNFSTFLSEKIHYEYHYLSHIFSEEMGVTIEHYIILHKIERAKELIAYTDLTLTEIAYKLHYSSVAHLSNQFKKVTKFTPSVFKHIKNKRLIDLENLCFK